MSVNIHTGQRVMSLGLFRQYRKVHWLNCWVFCLLQRTYTLLYILHTLFSLNTISYSLCRWRHYFNTANQIRLKAVTSQWYQWQSSVQYVCQIVQVGSFSLWLRAVSKQTAQIDRWQLSWWESDQQEVGETKAQWLSSLTQSSMRVQCLTGSVIFHYKTCSSLYIKSTNRFFFSSPSLLTRQRFSPWYCFDQFNVECKTKQNFSLRILSQFFFPKG